MCAPLIAVAAIAVVGGVTSGVIAKKKADAQASAFKAQAKQVRNDAITEAAAGSSKARAARFEASVFYAQQKSRLSANSQNVTSGSAARVLSSTQSILGYDISTIVHNTSVRSNSLRAKASFLDYQGDLATQAGNLALTSSIIGGITKAAGIGAGSLGGGGGGASDGISAGSGISRSATNSTLVGGRSRPGLLSRSRNSRSRSWEGW